MREKYVFNLSNMTRRKKRNLVACAMFCVIFIVALGTFIDISFLFRQSVDSGIKLMDMQRNETLLYDFPVNETYHNRMLITGSLLFTGANIYALISVLFMFVLVGSAWQSFSAFFKAFNIEPSIDERLRILEKRSK